ncbi:acyl-CoA desaturase [Oleiharenicola lentus]|uniref:Acyl-CoA desaturase n=1 Tax=Oleiharenicola lentus TaxID=2508720 RepID=A0A4V1M6S6_9BACT|nr:fatty acid desaturase [Oleiharenicola lentus]RXK56429.1 acyl-CoA desaturase [Oleiharenicola lentus]
MKLNLPTERINWVNSSFLIGTALVTCTVVPLYLWHYGMDAFQVALFFGFFIATGLSITLGYHRLFAHVAFQASWPVRLATLVFGAAAFENCALAWVSDHRRHHKHVDHDDDPYDISKGFWHAHIGWILFKLDPAPPWDNVADLRKDRLVMLQQRFYVPVAVLVGFALPAALGWWHNGWIGALGGFLIGGVARVTAVQHMTFFINSLCHTIGNQPYSNKCSARDSWLMAIFTFGEGYHNYHHEFQHDYRNGVKWWQWDPTKWTIWTLEKLRLVRGLRRVSEDKILLAQLTDTRRRLGEQIACPKVTANARLHDLLKASDVKLHELGQRWEALKAEYAGKASALRTEYSDRAQAQFDEARHALEEMRREVRQATRLLRHASAAA